MLGHQENFKYSFERSFIVYRDTNSIEGRILRIKQTSITSETGIRLLFFHKSDHRKYAMEVWRRSYNKILISLPRFVQSWIETREVQSEKANLLILFDKYVPMCLETMKHRFKKITPIVEMSHVQMLCHLLECLLTPENTPPDCQKELYELYFVFACVWAFGGCTFQDQVILGPYSLTF